jgi:hypothetical protein
MGQPIGFSIGVKFSAEGVTAYQAKEQCEWGEQQEVEGCQHREADEDSYWCCYDYQGEVNDSGQLERGKADKEDEQTNGEDEQGPLQGKVFEQVKQQREKGRCEQSDSAELSELPGSRMIVNFD